jgi:RNA polymerase sigma-70 factor (ECF subfamily)
MAGLCSVPAPDPGTDNSSPDEEEDEKRLLLRQAAEMVLETCEESTRQAFLRVVAGGEAPADVARDLGLSVAAVYAAKSRTLRKLREEFTPIVEL